MSANLDCVAQTATVSTQLEVLSAPAGLAMLEMASTSVVQACLLAKYKA